MGKLARWEAITLAIMLAACGASPPPPPPPPLPAPPVRPPAALPPPAPPSHDLSAPPLALTLIDAPTAQVFHIVDELSRWYPQAHAEYGEWAKKEMPLDDAEETMLAIHAKLRAKRRWGSLDQAFSVNAPVAEAAHAAVARKLLSVPDAENERVLLEHFEARLRPFLESRRAAIGAFEARVASELPRVAPLFAQLGRFCEVTDTLSVRAVLVPSPAQATTPIQGAGRAAGGTIVLEISAVEDSVPAFFHHLAHAVLLQRRGTIAIAARSCDEAVDDETLEDGLAYAFAPGLVHPSGHDTLREIVEAYANQRGALRDPRVRAERLGLAIRTALGGALEGGHETIGSFMPRACEAWANVAKP